MATKQISHHIIPYCFMCKESSIQLQQERLLGQQKTPPANKLPVHNVTSRLTSNTTRKYIFTEYRSSITQYLNGLDFGLSRSLKLKSIGAIRLLIYALCHICHGGIGLPIYCLPLMLNSNNLVPL